MENPVHCRFTLIALSLLLASGGCQSTASGPDPGPVALRPGNALLGGAADVVLAVEAAAFEPGEPMTLTLEHRGGEPIGYNFCTHGMDQRSGDGWTLLEFLRLCTAHLDLLDPGETATFETTVPPGLAAGEYRVRLPLLLTESEQQRDVVSQTFRVGA